MKTKIIRLRYYRYVNIKLHFIIATVIERMKNIVSYLTNRNRY